MAYDYQVTQVVRVVDGDTVDLRLDVGFHITAVVRVRILGVDTPERSQPGWADATAFTRAWLTARPLRALTYKTDSFGRWLALIYDADTKEDLSVALIEKGHSWTT